MYSVHLNKWTEEEEKEEEEEEEEGEDEEEEEEEEESHGDGDDGVCVYSFHLIFRKFSIPKEVKS
jgi:hypothetical protein